MKKIFALVLLFAFSFFCVKEVLAEKQSLINENRNKLSELLYDKISNSNLSFLGDELKDGIDKFFNKPKFYVKENNIFFVFDGKLF
jgi:hypothetical protein